MDIVYTSLNHRRPTAPATAGEVAEVLDALWLHAAPTDGLEHASARQAHGRIDLLFYLLNPDTDARCSWHRAAELLARCHHSSPLLRHRYLPPGAQVEATADTVPQPPGGPVADCTCPRP